MGQVRSEDRITISDMADEAKDQMELARISEIANRNLGDDAYLLAEPEPSPTQVPSYAPYNPPPSPSPNYGAITAAPVSRSNQDYTYTPTKKQITLSREELSFCQAQAEYHNIPLGTFVERFQEGKRLTKERIENGDLPR
jgi:hypothetical protein